MRVAAAMVVLGSGVAVMAAPITEARAFMGRCLLQVDHRAYLNGPCNIEMLGEGSFSIGTGENRSRYFAYVLVDRATGRASGSWNGPSAASHAHEELGELTRQGACWVNARARVCAVR